MLKFGTRNVWAQQAARGRFLNLELNFAFFTKNKGRLQAVQIDLGEELVKEGKQKCGSIISNACLPCEELKKRRAICPDDRASRK